MGINRKSSSSSKEAHQGSLQEGNPYPHQGTLLPWKDRRPSQGTQVCFQVYPQEERIGQVLCHQVPFDHRVLHEAH
jgi:hypothetical protein